jgi:hypothetical protein
MPFVIFYSWQSDLNPKTTRHFIREALDIAVRKLARELEVEEVLRVDQDTQGTPGHPEIFRTICGKIDNCALFVADLTYVGATETGDRIPNPNVAIELGYALKSIGPDRYIAVMNTNYGGPDDLPFDLQHRRWPIRYCLSPEALTDERNREKQELANALAGAIRSIIESGLLNVSASVVQVAETPSTSSPAVFFDESKPFAIRDGGKGVELHILRGAKMYLRLIPTRFAEGLTTADAHDIARASGLEPMRDAHTPTGVTWVRNQHGVAAVAMNWDIGEVFALTQILKRTREIWGVDALTINEEHCKEWSKVDFGYFPCSAVEKIFDASLAHYTHVAKDHLGLALPLRFIVGVDGVAGHRMALPPVLGRGFGGRMVEDQVRHEGMIESFDVDSHELLLPFYVKLWRECDLKRPEGRF